MGILETLKDLLKPSAKELTEAQAEGGLVGVRKAWAESVASGLTPEKLAGILRDCDAGDTEAFMILAEEMEERDPHYASVMGQRKRAVSGIRPIVVPYSESAKDKEIAEWVEKHIAGSDEFSGLVEDLMDAIGKGFSVVEIAWATDKTAWWPEEFDWRPQRFFQFDKETGRELRLRDEKDPLNGVQLERHKFIVHKAKLKSGHVFRGGVARVVAFGWMCKAYTLKDWMTFIETFGLPIRLGKYGPEAKAKDIAVLFRAVANIGTDAAAVMPKSMDIELVDNKSGGGTQPVFENLARYIDEQTSKIVLGQTMTTDNGSSQAQANVHNDVRHDIAASDARSVTGTINRDLVRPAVVMNFGQVEGFPTLKIVVEEPEDIQMMVEAIATLAEVGVPFKASEARAKVKMSDPEEGDEIFGELPAVEEPETARERHTARENIGGDVIDEIAAELLSDWEPVLGELEAPFIAAIAGATSYEDATERLNAIEGMPSSQLIDQLTKAMFAARAVGDAVDV